MRVRGEGQWTTYGSHCKRENWLGYINSNMTFQMDSFIEIIVLSHSVIRNAVCCLVAKLCLTCDPMDCSLLDFSVRWISQARILEWVVISFSKWSSSLRNWTHVSWIAGRFFTAEGRRNTIEKLYTLCPMVIFYKTIISSVALQLKW